MRAVHALREHGAGLLAVQRLDRFSRDPLTAAMAELQVAKAGARVMTADGVGNGDDPGSRLMKDVALAAARFERSMIAARTKAALAVKKSRRESTGTPPYGWRVGEDGKTLAEDPEEQETLRRVRALRARGWPYRQILQEATRMGWMSRRRKPFTLQAIFRMAGAAAEPSSEDGVCMPLAGGKCRGGGCARRVGSTFSTDLSEDAMPDLQMRAFLRDYPLTHGCVCTEVVSIPPPRSFEPASAS